MKSYKILLFIICAIGLLALLAIVYPQDGVTICGKILRMPTIHKIITPKEELDIEQYLKEQQEAHDALVAQLTDSAQIYRYPLENGDIRFWFPDSNINYFVPLFEKLDSAQAQGRTIRVMHYGDSQIEMDRLSDRLRAKLQSIFGGGGPGALPFQAVIRSLSVTQRSSGVSHHYAPYGDSTVSRNNGHYGPLMHAHHVAGQATATFTATKYRNADSALMAFSTISMIFDNQSDTCSATLTTKEGKSYTKSSNKKGVQRFYWCVDTTTEVRISFHGIADMYGVMVDNGAGVAVDNLPMRGCSGQQFTMINSSELTKAYALMDVGLIIMQFGGNSVPYIHNEKSLSTYTHSIGVQIDHLHKCCPDACILFIGPSDMCTTIAGEKTTYPYLPSIIQGIRDTVTQHNAAYWSIYDAMGGKSSMKAWVNQGFGSPDYIHFTQKGANIMGDRIAESFVNLYRYCRCIAKCNATSEIKPLEIINKEKK